MYTISCNAEYYQPKHGLSVYRVNQWVFAYTHDLTITELMGLQSALSKASVCIGPLHPLCIGIWDIEGYWIIPCDLSDSNS